MPRPPSGAGQGRGPGCWHHVRPGRRRIRSGRPGRTMGAGPRGQGKPVALPHVSILSVILGQSFRDAICSGAAGRSSDGHPSGPASGRNMPPGRGCFPVPGRAMSGFCRRREQGCHPTGGHSCREKVQAYPVLQGFPWAALPAGHSPAGARSRPPRGRLRPGAAGYGAEARRWSSAGQCRLFSAATRSLRADSSFCASSSSRGGISSPRSSSIALGAEPGNSASPRGFRSSVMLLDLTCKTASPHRSAPRMMPAYACHGNLQSVTRASRAPISSRRGPGSPGFSPYRCCS